jgi:hypothetical protein
MLNASIERLPKTENPEKISHKVESPTTNPTLTDQVTKRVRLLRGLYLRYKTEAIKLGHQCVFLSGRNAQT